MPYEFMLCFHNLTLLRIKAHGIMMESLQDDAGRYRNNGVGVFDGSRYIHMAPPAWCVKDLMYDLFNWLKHSKDHLLIRSCVFHYEFEFIHPFSDGNGRMGRLWQSLILGKLNPVFEHLPVENMVYANQQNYYEAINRSTKMADCAPFIDLMLHIILDTIQSHQGEKYENVGENVGEKLSERQRKILSIIRENPYFSAIQIAQ